MKRVFFISLIGVSLLLTICCQSKKKVTGPDKKPDFAIEVSPQTQWVTAGESAEYQIKLTSLYGFSAPCTLSVVGFPEGDSVAFDSTVLVPTDSSQLTIYTTFSTSRDTSQLTVTAKNKNLTYDTQVLLVVPPEKVTDYYPLAIGNSWTYVWLDQNGRTWMTTSLTITDTATINGNFGYLFSDIMFIYVKGGTIFSKSGEIVLLGPLVVGQSWTDYSYTYELIEFGAVTLTEGTEYQNCAKIRKTRPDYPGEETFEWWAKDVGFVKMEEYISGRYQGSRELKSFILH